MSGNIWLRTWVAYVVLATSLTMTLCAWLYVRENTRRNQAQQLQHVVHLLQDTIHQQTDRYIDILLATRGFFDASSSVSRQQWKIFAQSIDLHNHYPGMMGIGFAQRVEPDEMDLHLGRIRQEVAADYQVFPPGRREVYFPIVYLEPFDDLNRRAFGFDMFYDPTRRQAMTRAGDTGQPTVTGPVALIQDLPAKLPGLIVYIPVYKAGMPVNTWLERRAALTGFVFSPYRVADLINGILREGRVDIQNLDFQIYDGSLPTSENLLYDSNPTTRNATVPASILSTVVNFGGRDWSIWASPKFVDPGNAASLATLVLLSGILVSWLLFGLSYVQIRARLQSEQGTQVLKKSERALRISELRYRLKIEQSPLGISIYSRDGKALYFNPSWEKLWEVSSSAATSYNILQDDQLGSRDIGHLIRRAFAGEIVIIPPTYYDPTQSSLPGRPRWVRIIMYPIKDDAGQVLEVVCMQEDFTDRKLVEEELRRAKESAEAANRAKDQFLAVLSHELRNPLSPVLSMVNALQNQSLNPEESREALAVISRNVELEARLIDDLLDITRITKGKLHLDLEPTDGHSLMHRAIEITQSEINAKDHRLVIDLAAVEHFVSADPVRLQQVFWNLLKNAVKFTPEHGSITVRTWNEDRGQGIQEARGQADATSSSLDSWTPGPLAPYIAISITDTGIGIEPETLPRIFDAFEQLDRSITRRFGGLGLGMAISKALIDAHRGSIRVTSQGKNSGTTVTITMPTIPESTPRPEPRHSGLTPTQAADHNESSNGALRILLVEDQPDARRGMALLLQKYGFAVKVASDVAEAIKLANQHAFDLLISDIGLPDVSGFELMRMLRAHPMHAHISAIALTGLGMEQDIRKAHEAGFDQHLTKPIDINRLMAAIDILHPVQSNAKRET